MIRCGVARGVVSALAVAAMVASCGGSDSGGGAAPGSADTPTNTLTDTPADTATATDSATVTDSATESSTGSDLSGDGTTVTDVSSSGDTVDESSSGGGVTTNCDAMFSTAEIEEFFAEPADLTEETNDSLGQLLCTWESVEDLTDTEDLAAKVLVLQFYSGVPIPAASFFDPSMFDTVTTIEGVGDLGYSTDAFGPAFFFVDEPVGGTLSYSEIDFGSADGPKLRTADDVEQLFRTFHDRVT